jgi:hypothetical protein
MMLVDLPRVRAALRALDDLAGKVRPMGSDELSACYARKWSDAMKMVSIRLTGGQVEEMARLAVELQRVRPDLAALARGGEMSPYTVLRLAVERGLRALAEDVATARRGTT